MKKIIIILLSLTIFAFADDNARIDIQEEFIIVKYNDMVEYIRMDAIVSFWQKGHHQYGITTYSRLKTEYGRNLIISKEDFYKLIKANGLKVRFF